MMKKLLILGFITVLSGCSDKLNLSALNGTYTGKFYYTPPAGSIKTGNASVSFSDNTYSSTADAERIPAGGSGTLEILQDDVINFKDQNIWTANFDWGLILSGKYKYEMKNDSLILTRYNEHCPPNENCGIVYTLYQYRLKRTN
jgi:hypothetical protein